MAFSISLQGVPELVAALAEISSNLEAKVFRQTLREACKQFAAECQANAPRGETGVLSSITPKVRAMRRKKGRIGYQCRYAPGEMQMGWYVNAVDHGAVNSGRSKATIPPQRWVEKSFAKIAPGLQNELPAIMAEKLEAVIEKANRSKL